MLDTHTADGLKVALENRLPGVPMIVLEPRSRPVRGNHPRGAGYRAGAPGRAGGYREAAAARGRHGAGCCRGQAVCQDHVSFDHEAFWSARYRDAGENYLFGIAPNKFLAAQAERFGADMTVLSVADGEGRNAVWLAEQGCRVTATEISPVALEKAAEARQGAACRGRLATGGHSELGMAARCLRCRGRHLHPVRHAGRAAAADWRHEAGGQTGWPAVYSSRAIPETAGIPPGAVHGR